MRTVARAQRADGRIRPLRLAQRAQDAAQRVEARAHGVVAERVLLGQQRGDEVALGEVGAAFLVTSTPEPPDDQTVMSWCQQEMANYKIPKVIRWVDSLPLNASGKVLKTVLRERL